MLNDVKNRVRKLESKSGASDVVLWFADSSTRSVRIPDPLSVLLAAMKRTSRQIEPPEGMEDDTPDELETPSKYDEIVNLLGRAQRIETDDVFLQLVQGASKQALQEESADCKSRKTSSSKQRNQSPSFVTVTLD